MKHEIFVCDCQEISHQLVLSYDEENIIEPHATYSYPVSLDVSVKLNIHLSFFKRIWTGIKYIFKFGENAYDFDTVILSDLQVKKLNESLEKYLAIGRVNEK